jgi:serine/threonine protein kinase
MEGERNHTLRWDEPLLKLAIEIAEGMTYLHAKTRKDPKTGEEVAKDCILHRDLKPENVLITEFLSAKITDFGTSRAKETNANVTMTAVGTPLYCAPEIVKGEIYDEKVDIYSFGLILMDMAIEESLLSFLGERWRVHFRKKVAPKQPMRFIRAMTEDGWRPIGQPPPPPPANKTPSVMEGKEGVTPDEEAESIPTDLPGSPGSIEKLVIMCCAQDPKERPTFPEILKLLKDHCFEEIHHNKKFGGFEVSKLKERVEERRASTTDNSSRSKQPARKSVKKTPSKNLDEKSLKSVPQGQDASL